MNVNIKKTKLKPHGTRLQIIIDGFKMDYWHIGYRASKSTAYRKGFSVTGETETFNNDSPTSETESNNRHKAPTEPKSRTAIHTYTAPAPPSGADTSRLAENSSRARSRGAPRSRLAGNKNA